MAVLGIGGLFFRAKDPETLSNWYRRHLNVGAGCAAENAGAPDDTCWIAQGGPVVFAPFASDTDYFPGAFMLNFRVSGLSQMIEKLRNEGIAVETREEWNDPNVGSFARIQDPEGNPVELWEPAS